MTGSGTGVTPAGAATPLVLPGVTQNWDKNLPSDSRFTVLAAFGGAAVRDNNTGLVWEKALDITGGPRANGTYSWSNVTTYCINKPVGAVGAVGGVGGTRGWRLPSVAELASLIDPSLPVPFVPLTVFTGVQSSFYWSATTNAGNPSLAWYVGFINGDVGDSDKANGLHAWCVRGGMNADAY
jgi:hypothetical protein